MFAEHFDAKTWALQRVVQNLSCAKPYTFFSGKQLMSKIGHFTSTPWAIKKRATFIFAITLANVDQFQ